MTDYDHEWRFFDKILRTLRVQKAQSHISKGSILCDLGCGQEAYLLKKLRNHIRKGYGFDLLVSDFEEGNIKVAQARLLDSIPLGSESVDAVTVLAAFEHLENDVAITKDIYRILRPGGALVVTVPTPYGKWLLETLARFGIINKAEILDHKRYYKKEDLHILLARGGFREENITSHYWEFGGNLFARAVKEL